MKQYTFALAELPDVPQVVALYHSLIGTPGCTWSLEYPSETDAVADIANRSLYVLRDDGEIIAVASAGDFGELKDMTWSPSRPAELARIGVLLHHQRRGVGGIILRHVLSAVRQRGFDGVVMLVAKANAAAQTLYQRHGFERSGEVFLYGHDFDRYEIKFT